MKISKAYNILLLFFFASLLFSFPVHAQNLVPNPSFEDTLGCPTTLDELSSTTFWTAPTDGSPDFFHACNSGAANVPDNTFGSQYALSGDAYAGIGVYDTLNNYSYREYIQVQLQQALISGQKYWVSFYCSLADKNYAIQEMGAFFSLSQINDSSMDTTLPFIPQIEFSDGIITNDTSWSKVSGSFTATGGENYLIIGNFNRSQMTTAIQVNNNSGKYSYYYVDDVCVSDDSLLCNQTVGISPIPSGNSEFSVFPNPVMGYFQIYHKGSYPYNLVIYNSLGQLLYKEENITNREQTIDVNDFTKGLLLIKISTNIQISDYKLLNL